MMSWKLAVTSAWQNKKHHYWYVECRLLLLTVITTHYFCKKGAFNSFPMVCLKRLLVSVGVLSCLKIQYFFWGCVRLSVAFIAWMFPHSLLCFNHGTRHIFSAGKPRAAVEKPVFTVWEIIWAFSSRLEAFLRHRLSVGDYILTYILPCWLPHNTKLKLSYGCRLSACRILVCRTV